MSRNWSSSSCGPVGLTERQAELFAVFQECPGDHTTTFLSKRIGGKPVDGDMLFGLQVRILEMKLGRLKRQRAGRFTLWTFTAA